jgi:hypothetical protein
MVSYSLRTGIVKNLFHLGVKLHCKGFLKGNLGPRDKVNFISGGIAGVTGMTITHPLERVKMMKIFGVKEVISRNFIQSIYFIAKTRGFKEIYRGNRVS